MRPRPALALLALVTLGLPALAEETTESPTLHRDPRGLKGLTVFWEAVKKGDDAVLEQNFDAARAAYDEAIKAEPNNPMGFYRLGEALAIQGNLKDAAAAFQDALRLAADKPPIRAKVLFVIADVKERQRAFDEAAISWSSYETYGKANRGPGVFTGVAFERKKRVEEAARLATEYAAVKDRIKQRLAEADRKAAASAQSPQNR